jgi:glutamate dehydrogenase (NAD(P)+)
VGRHRLRRRRSCRRGNGAPGTPAPGCARRHLDDLGAIVVAVSTAHGALHDPSGLDVETILAARELHGDAWIGSLASSRAKRLDAGGELDVDADVLVPAATQDVIDAERARALGFEVVVEGANLPIQPAAQDVLAGRGVTVVPDFIANAGGVVAAAFAMDARHSPFPAEAAAIFEAVSHKMRINTATVLAHAGNTGETSHAAARRLAADRVRAAMRLKMRTPEKAAA